MSLLKPTEGLTVQQRFTSREFSINSLSYECVHGKHYEVEVHNRLCNHKNIIHHTHSYRNHWDAMYDASERLIVPGLRLRYDPGI